MYIPGNSLEPIEVLSARLQQLTKALLEGFPLDQDTITLEGIDDLYQQFDADQLFLITDGMIHISHEGQNLVAFDEGDLIGFNRAFELPCPTFKVDEFAEVKLIDRDDFLRHVYSDKRRQHYWSHFLCCQNNILLYQISLLSKSQTQTIAGFQNYQPGDVIIKEGDDAEHVYTIISGTADVFANGVKVGDVGEDEVFGAMAVFTGEKRSATVIAGSVCTVMAVPQNEFVNLIEAKPKAAVNLIENLARRITTMNQQLIDQQK